MIGLILISAALIVGAPSVQERVDATPPGGTLVLEAGEYSERLVLSRPITLRGAGVDKTVLRSPWGAVVVAKATEGEVVIEGLTMTGGGRRPTPVSVEYASFSAGALFVTIGARVVLREVALRDNRSEDWGGGANVEGALLGEHVRIEANGSSIGAGGLKGAKSSRIELVDSVIVGNWAMIGARQVEFSGKELKLKRVKIVDPGDWGSGRGVQLTLFKGSTDPSLVTLEQLTIGASSGSSVLVGENANGIPNVVLIDTEWPADADVPPGWKPVVRRSRTPKP
jgi:hypothetical protein